VEVRHYVTRSGIDVLAEWLAKLADDHARARVAHRIDRLSMGNFGDRKSLGGGLGELRIDWGPGYRVYYAMIGQTCVVLLCGGDKRRQASDIQRAREYFKDYLQRTRTQ
jgi:putative addiction module killer protein